MTIFLSILIQGLIYSLMALGVYITYSILDFPDLSVDSTFPFGAAVTAAALLSGVPAWLTLPLAFLAGALAGTVTGLIHVKLKVRDLLSGIIVMTGLYSINLIVAGNKANLPIYSQETIFENEMTSALSNRTFDITVAVILFVIVLIVKLLLDLYLKTRSGLLLRAAGDNETLVTALAKDKGTVKIIGLALANGLAALPAAGLFRAQRRDRNHCHRPCKRDYRNKALCKAGISENYHCSHPRLHSLQGLYLPGHECGAELRHQHFKQQVRHRRHVPDHPCVKRPLRKKEGEINAGNQTYQKILQSGNCQ